MERFIQVGERKWPLTEDQAKEVLSQIDGNKDVKLAEVKVGETCLIGQWELLVLDHVENETVVILKDLLLEDEEFGSNNCYDGSKVDAICNEFAEKLADVVGEETLTEFEVDLTSDDGLKDYGSVRRKAALLTAEQYRKYVGALDQEILEEWWWLATPHSTERHVNASWVKCVSSRGFIDIGNYNIGNCGVRPFCILKSNIFVSR